MIVDADLEVAMSLCDVCPAADSAGVAETLLLCFESRNKVMQLLKAFIEKEVASTGRYMPPFFILACVHVNRDANIDLMQSKKRPCFEARQWERGCCLSMRKWCVSTICVSRFNPL